jgi:2-methylcitrate dehydratase
VEKKFRLIVEPRYGKEKADRFLAACWELEKLKRIQDMMEFFVL